MHAEKLNRVVRQLHAAGPTDRDLLTRFLAGDEPAFAALVGRHGPMVLRVCRRLLRHEQDAEDAFQATFLVLARRAGAVRRGEAVASWLHGVARRVALRARRDAGRRRAHERAAPPVRQTAPTPDWPEVQAALDDAIGRLPERYRGPFVLCFLEGRSRAEAAGELGLAEGTVWSRLSEARRRLRERLARRGIELPALLAAVAITEGMTSAAPAGLFDTTARAVRTAGGVPARTAALAAAASRTLSPIKSTAAVLGLVAAGLLAVGAMVRPVEADPPPPAAKPAIAAADPPKPAVEPDPDDPKTAGTFRGRVSGTDGKPVAGASIYIVPVHAANQPGTVRARTDADGRFAFDAADMTYPAFDGLPKRREGFIVATKEGFAPDWTETWGHTTYNRGREWWMPRQGAAIELKLAPDDRAVHGRFLDPAGRPLAGARVQLTSLGWPYEFDLNKHLDREAKADMSRGFLTVPKIYERNTYRVNLLPGLATETRTDAEGRFRLTGVGRDRLAHLRVSAPGVIDTDLEVMARDAADVGTMPEGRNGKPTGVIHGSGFTRQLKPGLTVTGIVRDRDTKAPVPGMWVTQYANPLTDPSRTDEAATTDAAGRFTLSGLNPELVGWEEKHRQLTAVSQPGTPYLTARATVEKDAEVVFEAARGIPFRLTLADEQGKPVEGTVEYHPVDPNPQIEELIRPVRAANWPVMSRAARRVDGRYEGFVLPGPGAVVVEMPDRREWRPALVDPRAFFRPGRTDWTPAESHHYGSRDTLAMRGGRVDQNDYAAIVLVNPPAGSGPLELTATVVRDRPRRVSLVDPAGQPVVGVDSRMRWPRGETHEDLRAATFLLPRLHPDRVKQMTFFKADRKLIGMLVARGDTDAAITVRMEPWGVLTGRLVDANAAPLAGRPVSLRLTDPVAEDERSATTDKQGRFRIERLIPGREYASPDGTLIGPLTLQSGEARDLGDLHNPLPKGP